METLKDIVLGTAQFIPTYGIGQHVKSLPAEVLRAAERAGCRTVDTAPAYGDAELLVGQHWSRKVHTKFDKNLSAQKSVENSLRKLGRSTIDVVYLHEPAEILLGDSSSVLGEAEKLIGLSISSIGASVYEISEFESALEDPRVDVIQVPLNVLDRRFGRERIAEANARGKRVFGRSVLLQGALVSSTESLIRAGLERLGPFVAEFEAAVADTECSATAVAIAWARSQGLSGVLVGVDTVEQLQEISDHLSAVTDRDLRTIDSIGLPTWEQVDPRRWTAA
jgi:aryl-alcohol dehydrogenase-like predicted oxidoreductase